MPGSSLWLVPPKDHPLYAAFEKLISETLPQRFPEDAGPPFSPHMTLTSNIDPAVYGDKPQEWLDSIPFPARPDVQVRLQQVKSEEVFFRRCYVKVEYGGVRDVVAMARARGVNGEAAVGPKTEAWLQEWREAFGPHVSLIYGNNTINEQRLGEISQTVQDAGVQLDNLDTKEGAHGSWEGGDVWLVPTDRKISEWLPIATRKL
ncbi:2',3'-cyclic-nucleotide 3'-phosphodiesterase [Xylariales sp. PMI_506]|nr:2',3'-cyclic-nucleotide 3'-phosphodiesterase [Xylariales sp. PMI_506]